MIRAILGVLAGYVVWTAIWLLGNALLFAEELKQVAAGIPLTDTTVLAKILGLSAVCSLAAGVMTAAIVKRESKTAMVLVMAALLLGTGVAVQAGQWNLMPVWFHLTFLGLLVPVAYLGSRAVARSS
jgi:hypothetical protein